MPAGDVTRLREEARRAATEGVEAVIVRPGPLGDPIVLAAGLVDTVPGGLLGAALSVEEDGRHPSVLARDLTALDHVCRGRAVLCLLPPFDDGTVEAIAICRAMWRHGVARGTGPRYPVPGAVNRPLPPGRDSPWLALDLTGSGSGSGSGSDTGSGAGSALESAAALVDVLVFGTDDPVEGECRLQRVRPA